MFCVPALNRLSLSADGEARTECRASPNACRPAFQRPKPSNAEALQYQHMPFSLAGKKTARGCKMMVPAITLYVVLVWFLWGFFMALGWAVGTWIAGQLIGARWKVNRG